MTQYTLASQIAFVHLMSRKKQTFIAALGVTFGISVFIAMIGMMNGINNLLEDLTLSATPHIHMYRDIQRREPSVMQRLLGNTPLIEVHHERPKNEQKKLRNALTMLDYIRKDPDVYGASPLLTAQVFYQYGQHEIGGTIAGVDILEEHKLFGIGDKLIGGNLYDVLTTDNGIIIGSGLAETMQVNVGDKINVTTVTGTRVLLRIVGIVQMGIGAIDNSRSYSTLHTAQRLLQKDKSFITDINIKLRDLYKAKDKSHLYSNLFGYKAEDWETANASILVSFTLRNTITYSVSVALLIVAGFGIYNILNMTIYEKMRDIAILKATGFSGGDVKAIFMIQALSLGLGGAIAGLLVGLLMSYGISKIPFEAKGVINLTSLSMSFSPLYYAIGLVFGLLTTAAAGYLPSRKAGKIDPVEIIRGK